MKIKYLVFLTNFCFFYSIFITHPYAQNKFDKILEMPKHRINQIAGEFDVSDATELINIIGEKTSPFTLRRKTMILVETLNDKRMFSPLKSLYYTLLLNIDSINISNNQAMNKEAELFARTVRELGKLASDEAINFLKSQLDLDVWKKRKKYTQYRGAISGIYSARRLIFTGLGEAAIKRPEIFDFLKSYHPGDQYWESDVKYLLIEYENRYYQKHPEELPPKGYFLIMAGNNEVKYAIFYTSFRQIGNYVKKHRAIPQSILDLTIPRGGTEAYLFGDNYKRYGDRLLTYKSVKDEDDETIKYTYLLLSVGPNGKLETNLDKFKSHIDPKDIDKVFGSHGDDIIEVKYKTFYRSTN